MAPRELPIVALVRRLGWSGFSVASRAQINGAQSALAEVIDKARFWEKLRDVPLDARQRLVINRLLEGLQGHLTTSKWAALTKSSTDTALRDVQQLVDRGVLIRNEAGGRKVDLAKRQVCVRRSDWNGEVVTPTVDGIDMCRSRAD